jgi:hypothetical protein
MRKQGIKCEYGVTSALVSLFFFTPSSCSFFSLFSVKNNWSVVDAVIRVATMNQRDEPLQKASYYARSRRRMHKHGGARRRPSNRICFFLDPAKGQFDSSWRIRQTRTGEAIREYHRMFCSCQRQSRLIASLVISPSSPSRCGCLALLPAVLTSQPVTALSKWHT